MAGSTTPGCLHQFSRYHASGWQIKPRCSLWSLLLGPMLGLFAAERAQARPAAGLVAPGWQQDALHLASGDASLKLRPALRRDGIWLASDEDCRPSGDVWSCPLGDLGEFTVTRRPPLQVSFRAQRSMTINSIGLRGELHLPGAHAWLSHGFQSWSQTGVLALQAPVSDAAVHKALAATGEAEVYRHGHELSWWYSAVGGEHASLVAGVVAAERLKSWLQFSREHDAEPISVTLASGAGESLHLAAGETLYGEPWSLQLGDDLPRLMQQYALSLPSRADAHPHAPLWGWNSWYVHWQEVTPGDVIASADFLASTLEQRPLAWLDPPVVVLDDGWQRAWGDWQVNAKFVDGLATVADTLHARGLKFGLWLAPLLVDPKAKLAREHPDWLVKDASYQQFPTGPRYRILDITHPAVETHLRQVMHELMRAGVDVFKIDFLFAGSFEGRRHQNITGMQAYHRALGLLREAVLDRTLLAVGAPPVATLEYVDAWRVGGDIAFKPVLFGYPPASFAFVANQARSIAGRYPFCLRTLCDPDPILLRRRSDTETEAAAWVGSLTGGAMFFSDALPRLPEQRWQTGFDKARLAQGLSGVPALPVDFWPKSPPHRLVSMKDKFYRAEHQVPTTWRMNEDETLLINFSPRTKEVLGHVLPRHTAKRQQHGMHGTGDR